MTCLRVSCAVAMEVGVTCRTTLVMFHDMLDGLLCCVVLGVGEEVER